MRIVVWNCNGALGRKLDALAELEPDVAVVPEAADPDRLEKVLSARSLSYCWTGRLPTKGLGVIGFRGWQVEIAREIEPRIEFALPVSVQGAGTPFNLLAVWAMNGRATSVYPVEPKRRQVQQAVLYYADLLRERPSIVAGDFNNHVRWDKPGKPANMRNSVSLLSEHGFTSAYHSAVGVDFGDEPEPTHYWKTRAEDRPTYHIDYCFVPATSALASVRLGSYADWVGSRLSDHVPLIVDVDMFQL